MRQTRHQLQISQPYFHIFMHLFHFMLINFHVGSFSSEIVEVDCLLELLLIYCGCLLVVTLHNSVFLYWIFGVVC